VASRRDPQVVADRDSTFSETVDLANELERIEYDAVADDAEFRGIEDAGWHEVHGVSLTAHRHGVARIGAAVVPDDDIMPTCQQIDDLALALVAPLQADNRRMTFRRRVNHLMPRFPRAC
jgi:hypothetical protein